MKKPKRIQLKRTKGWRKPAGAIVVSRPSKWGNPFRVSRGPGAACISREQAVRMFADYIMGHMSFVQEIRDALRGHDLACWCPLDQPCHADVLLEIANA